MADKEFTQICKEILGLSKKLEKIEPEELRKIKTDIERISEAITADKTLFDTNKKDFDGKYNKIAEIIKTFDTLKAQIEEVLKSGTINDSAEALISTFSSKKIMDLLNEAKRVINEKFSTIYKNGITPWNSTLEYTAGAISVLNGKLYQAKTQNINKKPSENKEIWHVIASEEWCERIFLNKDEKIDAYSKTESDEKFALKDDLPELATETKVGITKLKNSITAKAEDTAVTEKAVAEVIEANKGLGIGQTLQDVTADKRAGETYENTTKRTIISSVITLRQTTTCTIKYTQDGIEDNHDNESYVRYVRYNFILPPGSTYRVDVAGAKIIKWLELR
ncbi:hypothetical protein [Campylobacter concisus]|uniref:hypothetical protein n=1 Tax=Campylobacter concisus TaxID=199 RepID=UPI00122C8D83|nr:hypothetical protein [Campylobacter concisus]